MNQKSNNAFKKAIFTKYSQKKIPRYPVVILEALIEVQELKREDEAVEKVFELYSIAEMW